MIDSDGRPLNARRRRSPRCQRSRLLLAPQSDWMEWQAGYAGGALLMPITHIKELIGRIAEAFAVSKDAAKTRLQKLDYVAPTASEATA